MQNVSHQLKIIRVKKKGLLDEEAELKEKLKGLKEQHEKFLVMAGSNNLANSEEELKIERLERRLGFIKLYELPHVQGYLDRFEAWANDKQLQKQHDELNQELQDLTETRRTLEAQLRLIKARTSALHNLGFSRPQSHVPFSNHIKAKFEVVPYAWKKSPEEEISCSRGNNCDCAKARKEAAAKTSELGRALTARFNQRPVH